MLQTRWCVAALVAMVVGTTGCSRSSGVAAVAQPDSKNGHAAATDPQPERKATAAGHDTVPPGHNAGHAVAADPPPVRPAGTAAGELNSTKNTADGKNVVIEVLQPGEEKPRSYHVVYEPERKGPNPEVVASVRAAGVGDRVRFDWVQTGHGPAITKFEIVQKSANTAKDK